MPTVSAGNRLHRPTAVAAQGYWETKAVAYDCLHDRLREMLRVIAQRRPARIFDVGCSTGEVARGVTALLPQTRYFGCDISKAAVAKLGRPNVVQCDLNTDGVPFRDQRFDCIVASGICEYVADQQNLLKELARRLTPGGALLASYVNIDHIARRWRRWRGKRSRDNHTWQTLVPLAQFETWLQDAGLRIVERIPTHGRISRTNQVADRFYPTRHLCKWAPGLMSLLAPQVIFVCESSEHPTSPSSGVPSGR